MHAFVLSLIKMDIRGDVCDAPIFARLIATESGCEERENEYVKNEYGKKKQESKRGYREKEREQKNGIERERERSQLYKGSNDVASVLTLRRKIHIHSLSMPFSSRQQLPPFHVLHFLFLFYCYFYFFYN